MFRCTIHTQHTTHNTTAVLADTGEHFLLYIDRLEDQTEKCKSVCVCVSEISTWPLERVAELWPFCKSSLTFACGQWHCITLSEPETTDVKYLKAQIISDTPVCLHVYQSVCSDGEIITFIEKVTRVIEFGQYCPVHERCDATRELFNNGLYTQGACTLSERNVCFYQLSLFKTDWWNTFLWHVTILKSLTVKQTLCKTVLRFIDASLTLRVLIRICQSCFSSGTLKVISLWTSSNVLFQFKKSVQLQFNASSSSSYKHIFIKLHNPMSTVHMSRVQHRNNHSSSSGADLRSATVSHCQIHFSCSRAGLTGRILRWKWQSHKTYRCYTQKWSRTVHYLREKECVCVCLSRGVMGVECAPPPQLCNL